MLLRALLFLFLIGSPFVRAGEKWTGVADVKFRGYSTLHSFEGTVKEVPLEVTVAGEKGRRVVGATSGVPVKEMTTANEKRDANMWEMFRQAKYRLLKVEVKDAPESRLIPSGGKSGSMPVTLTIAGTRSTADAAVTNVSETSTRVSFDLAFPVSLAAFKLDPPKSLGGLVKVKDTVDVTAHVVLKNSAQ